MISAAWPSGDNCGSRATIRRVAAGPFQPVANLLQADRANFLVLVQDEFAHGRQQIVFGPGDGRYDQCGEGRKDQR